MRERKEGMEGGREGVRDGGRNGGRDGHTQPRPSHTGKNLTLVSLAGALKSPFCGVLLQLLGKSFCFWLNRLTF